MALRVREVLSMPGRLLSRLPAAFTVLCEACLDGRGNSVGLVLTTCAPDYAEAQRRRYVTLHGAEIAAVVVAAELDRATPAEFERWCALKQSDPSWDLTPSMTIGPVSSHGLRSLTVADVLRVCGAHVLNVAGAAPAPAEFWEVCRGG